MNNVALSISIFITHFPILGDPTLFSLLFLRMRNGRFKFLALLINNLLTGLL